MPLVKCVESLLVICKDFILEIQDSFCNKIPMSEIENRVVGALDSEISAINPFDGLRKLPNIFSK